MYATKTATKDEIAGMRRSIPSPMGHTITGFDEQFRPVVETDSEVSAVKLGHVVMIRRKMPSGKYIYRRIIER